MKKKFALIIVLALTCFSKIYSQQVIENPFFEVSNSGIVNISKIELSKNETRVHLHTTFIPHWWVSFSRNHHIQDPKTGEKYYPIRIEQGEFDKQMFMPDSGDSTFVMVYPKLPDSVKELDFACDKDEDNDPVFIGGISLDPHKSGMKNYSTVPDYVKTWIEKKVSVSNPKPLGIESDGTFFKKGYAHIVGYIKGYDPRLNYSSGMIYTSDEITREDSPIVLDVTDDGRFEVNIPVSYPVYGKIVFSNNSFIKVYYEADQTLGVILDQDDFLMADRFRNKQWEFKKTQYFGPTAKLNEELFASEFSIPDYNAYLDDIRNLKPTDFKTKYIGLWQRELGKVQSQTSLSSLSKGIIQNEIITAFSGRIIDYVMMRRNLTNSGEGNSTLQESVPDNFFDFLSLVPMNDPGLLSTENFYVFINRLEYFEPFTALQDSLYKSASTKTSLFTFLKKKGVQLTDEDHEYKVLWDTVQSLYVKGDSVEFNRFLKDVNYSEKSKQFEEKYKPYYSDWEKDITKTYIQTKRDLVQLRDSLLCHFAKQDVSLIADIIKARSIQYAFSSDTLSNDEKAYLKYLEDEIKDPFIKKEVRAVMDEKYFSSHLPIDLPEGKGTDVFRNIINNHKGKILFVDFWESSCAPCIMGIKNMKETRERYKDNNNFDFVFICSEDTPIKRYNEFSKEQGLLNSYRVTQNESQHLRQLFKFNGIPRYVVIDREGRLLDGNFNMHLFDHKLDHILKQSED